LELIELTSTLWIARFGREGIVWEENVSELSEFKIYEPTSCTNQHRNFGEFVPLCISFKPKQEEIIWQRELAWEKRRI